MQLTNSSLSTDSSHWLAIVNPAAGLPDGGASWRKTERALREADVRFEVVHTSEPGHGEELARRALRSGARRLIVAGGDGSVNDVVHGVMTAGLTDTAEVTLALAPRGSGNDWARSLGIPPNPRGVAALIAAGRTRLHDVGAIDFPTAGMRRWFINVAGAGYDAWVTEHVPRPVTSALTYLSVALQGLARYRSPEFRITTAEGVTLEGRMLLAFVANAQYCGNRMHVAPSARTDDGRFDVVAVRELSLLQVIPKLAKLYSGRILGDPAVRHLQSATVRIETDPPVSVQADGQTLERTPAEFSLRPRALRVVAAS